MDETSIGSTQPEDGPIGPHADAAGAGPTEPTARTRSDDAADRVSRPGEHHEPGTPRITDCGFELVDDGEVVWRFDTEFLRSRWTCVWGRGCQGILAEPAPELAQGCCSVGARIADEDEARRIVGLAAMVDPSRFQFHETARTDGVLEADRSGTRLVDGACIFLNRPGFAGGAGCALHLSAVADDESPIDWKASVCWQLPLRIEWDVDADGRDQATVRRWSRADWGDEPLAWWCTEDEGAFIADSPVVDGLAEELEAIAGTEVMVELRRRLR